MVEALNLFGSIVKNAYFAKTPIMLFLNKKDIFEEKIQYSDIVKVSHFNDYGGPPNDFDYGVLYFIQKFEEQLEGEFSDNFIHVTNATDTTNMEFVLNASRLIVMKEVSYFIDLGDLISDCCLILTVVIHLLCNRILIECSTCRNKLEEVCTSWYLSNFVSSYYARRR